MSIILGLTSFLITGVSLWYAIESDGESFLAGVGLGVALIMASYAGKWWVK